MRNLWCWASALALAATSVACSSSSDSGSSGGGRTMNLKGGKGLTYDGGTGGYFDVEGRTGAGGVKVLSAGSVNTDVSLPSRVPYLGTNAQIVSADTTLNVGASGFHLTAGSTTVTNGTGTVTGIWVKPGVTLTINPNYDTNNADVDNNAATGTREQVRFYLSDSLIVDGTIKIGKMDQTAAGDGLGVNTANVYTGYVGAWWISSSGKIDVSGADNVSGPGRNGGYLQAYPDTIYNAGIITTKGGTGTTDGGYGGYLYLLANNGYAVTLGTLSSAGGAGGTGYGGDAGWLDFEASYYGICALRGTISATGGNGMQGGGYGSSAYFQTSEGALVSSATIDTFGGDGTAINGYGGGGDYVEFYGDGPVRVAGSIDTHGGKGLGTGNGGSGGFVDAEAYAMYTWGWGEYAGDSAALAFGAAVDSHGGDGESGGGGGYFYVYTGADGYVTEKGAPILLAGYGKVDGSGGDGQRNGGYSGGYNYLDSWYARDESWSTYYAGPVVNQANFVFRGGNGTTGYGGDGYPIDMETEAYNYAPFDFGVTNSGAIDLSGGDGATNGGGGGYVYMYGKYFMTNSGAITTSAGKGGTGNGGNWSQEIYLASDGPATCSGAMTANGGNSASGSASSGGDVYCSGTVATVSGAISAVGGSSTSGAAGDGGYVEIFSQTGSSSVSGTPNVAKGTGTGSATDGDVWIDGTHVAGP